MHFLLPGCVGKFDTLNEATDIIHVITLCDVTPSCHVTRSGTNRVTVVRISTYDDLSGATKVQLTFFFFLSLETDIYNSNDNNNLSFLLVFKTSGNVLEKARHCCLRVSGRATFPFPRFYFSVWRWRRRGKMIFLAEFAAYLHACCLRSRASLHNWELRRMVYRVQAASALIPLAVRMLGNAPRLLRA